MLNRLYAISLFFILFLISNVSAQVTSSAEYIAATAYTFNGKTDSIFLFSEANADKYIYAESPNNSLTSFTWYTYDAGTNGFNILKTDADVLNSRQEVSGNAGYRLEIVGGGNHITTEFWVLINDLKVEIYNADTVEAEGINYKEVPTGQKWCHLIRDINARIDSADLSYYDLNNGDLLQLENSYSISWSAEPEATEIGINDWFYNDDFRLKIDIEYPNWEDSWYYITIEDDYLFRDMDSIFYESIEPHADFSYTYITLDDPFYYPDHEENYYMDYYNSANYTAISAPAKFRFNNLSINSDTLIWDFGDEEREIAEEDSLLHTYDLPGLYSPKLTVYNVVPHLYEVCADTFPKYNELVSFEDGTSYPINVDQATINAEADVIYNVISIPPDGINDYFRFTGDVSITDFEIAIYNRYGNKVYEFKGNIRDWAGWDGTKNGSGNYVRTGVYFYVVKELFVLPNDDRGVKPKLIVEQDPDPANHTNNVYRGFIHVYNSQ